MRPDAKVVHRPDSSGLRLEKSEGRDPVLIGGVARPPFAKRTEAGGVGRALARHGDQRWIDEVIIRTKPAVAPRLLPACESSARTRCLGRTRRTRIRER